MSDEQYANDASAASAPPSGSALPGALLAAQREKLGWSVEQVASQLKFSPRQIQAIESDNFAALPGMSVTKGFIRAYAKLLNIEPAPLLALMPAEESMVNRVLPVKQELSTPFSHARLRSNGKPGKSPALTLLFGGVLLVGAALLAAQYLGVLPAWRGLNPSHKDNESFTESRQELPAPAGVTLPERQSSETTPESPATEPVNRSTLSSPAQDREQSSGTQLARQATNLNSTEAKPSAEPATNAASSNDAQAEASVGENKLVLQIKEDSWIEIKRANGAAMISKVVKAGSTETFDIKEPVTLVVGNVRGVDASLRGVPLEMKAGKGNTIRLRLK